MSFKPISNEEVSTGQTYSEAISILEKNNIEWLYRSKIHHYVKGGVCHYDFGILKDVGILEIHEEKGKIYRIKLHLNWYHNKQEFKSEVFEINSHYSFPNGKGEVYKSCNLDINHLFLVIRDLQQNGHLAFPFLSPNLSIPTEIFPNYIREKLTTFTYYKSDSNKENNLNSTEYFVSQLSNNHRKYIGDLLSHTYQTDYNSQIFKAWNDLNAANKKLTNINSWNREDIQYNNRVGYILRAYDESFHDEQYMQCIYDFMDSDFFTHKMQCGLNITHILGLVKYQPLHDLLWEKFKTLEENVQTSLLLTHDQTGLTLPLLKLQQSKDEFLDESTIHYIYLSLKKYFTIPNFEKSLETSKASILDILPDRLFQPTLELLTDYNISIPEVYHEKNNLFNQHYNYEFKIENKIEIVKWLRGNIENGNEENRNFPQSKNESYAKKAATLHNFWLNQKIDQVLENKVLKHNKKMKI